MTNKSTHILIHWAALFAGCFFVSACENKMEDVQRLGKKNIKIEEAKNVQSFLSQNALLKAKLTAPVMLRYVADTAKIEFPKTLRADFYDSSLRVESQLFAKYGIYKENESKVFLKDSVVVFNIKRDTLFCNELWWDQSLGTFFTDKPVIIRQVSPVNQKIYGTGLTADQNFTWFRITNPTGFVQVPDSTLPANNP